MKKLAAILLLSLFMFSCGEEDNPVKDNEDNTVTHTVKMAFLVDNSAQSATVDAGAEFAQQHFNEDYSQANDSTKFKFEIIKYSYDGTPADAEAKIGEINNAGIRCVLAPENLDVTLALADNFTNITFFSYAEYSDNETVTKDNLYYMHPDNTMEAKNIATMLISRDIKNIGIALNKAEWANDMFARLRTNISINGGKNSMIFDVEIKDDLSLWESAGAIDVWVEGIDSINRPNYAMVTLLDVELHGILREASTFFVSDQITWVATSHNNFNAAVLASDSASEFVAKTKMLFPLFSYADGNADLAAEIRAAIGDPLDNSYYYSIYDSFFLMAQAEMHSKLNANVGIADAIVELTETEGIEGISGNLSFSDLKKRDYYTYRYYSLKENGGSYEWYAESSYEVKL